MEEDASGIEVVKEVRGYRIYSLEVISASTMRDVESIVNMSFDPEAQMEASELYEHSPGTAESRIRPEYRHIFAQSPSLCFFAYIPVYFWVEVVHQLNRAMREYESVNWITRRRLFTQQENMTFLFYFGTGGQKRVC